MNIQTTRSNPRRSLDLVAGLLLLTMSVPEAVSAVVIGNYFKDETAAAIAYNEDADEYLVVWTQQYSASNRNVIARRIDFDGTSLGPTFQIADTFQNEQLPTVAYNKDDRQYVVAYEYEFGPGDIDVYAQRVSNTGSLLGTAFPVAQSSNNELAPRIVYHPALQQYVVVWELEASWPNFDIQAATISATGVGNPFVITSSGDPEHAPDVDCQPATSECLFVWQQDQATAAVYGLAFNMSTGQPDSTFALAISTTDELLPRVSHGGGGEYLVVWQHAYSTIDWDIYGQRATGSQTRGSAITIAEEWVNEMNPDVSYKPSRGRYLVAWERYDGNSTVILPRVDVSARQVTDSGTLEMKRYFGSTSTDDQRPSVAAAAHWPYEGFIVWEHFVSGNWDIHGDLFKEN